MEHSRVKLSANDAVPQIIFEAANIDYQHSGDVLQITVNGYLAYEALGVDHDDVEEFLGFFMLAFASGAAFGVVSINGQSRERLIAAIAYDAAEKSKVYN